MTRPTRFRLSRFLHLPERDSPCLLCNGHVSHALQGRKVVNIYLTRFGADTFDGHERVARIR